MHKIIEEICASNEWRDGEFAKLKVNSSGVDEGLWFRMCIPMIYAHWEGYVVSALRILLGHLNDLELASDSVKSNFKVLSLGDAYGSLRGKQSFEQRVMFTEKFDALHSSTLKFDKKVNTKSNLKSDVLEGLCAIYDFDFSKFSDCTADINRLVNIRNSIAHGENAIKPTSDNIIKYITAVQKGTDILLNEIDVFLTGKAYTKPL